MGKLSKKKHGSTARLRRELLACAPRPLACAYCTREMHEDQMTIDHMTPLVRGGTDTLGNTCIACTTCNALKGPLTAEEFLAHRHDTAALKALTLYWARKISEDNIHLDPQAVAKRQELAESRSQPLAYTLSDVWPSTA